MQFVFACSRSRPHALFFLDMLQHAEFRERLLDPGYVQMMTQNQVCCFKYNYVERTHEMCILCFCYAHVFASTRSLCVSLFLCFRMSFRKRKKEMPSRERDSTTPNILCERSSTKTRSDSSEVEVHTRNQP